MASVHPYWIRCQRAALLTCVSNYKGVGPGHSAIVLDGYAYSFERVVGSWFVGKESGWLQAKTRDYLDANTHRPVIIQELDPGLTDATRIHDYIATSDLGDTDYGSSGVCSQQAASALSAGLRVSVNPWGMDTPHNIYRFLKASGAVAKTYYTFPEQDAAWWCSGTKMQMMLYYTPGTREPSPPILTW